MLLDSCNYILYGAIQNFKCWYQSTYGINLGFREAVSMLAEKGAVEYGPLHIPAFESWVPGDFRQLNNLLSEIPVPVRRIMEHKRMERDGTAFLEPLDKVQIMQESCCNPGHFLCQDYYSILYVVHGRAVLCLKGGRYPMPQGTVFILPPETPFYVEVTREDIALTISCHRQYFEENFRQTLTPENPLSDYFRKTILKDQREPQFFLLPPEKEICHVLQHLLIEYYREEPYADVQFSNYLRIFLTLLLRSTKQPNPIIVAVDPAQARARIPLILEYIMQHYRTLTLDSLAEEFHYSSAYLSRVLKSSTGKNLTQMVNELKVQEAKKLLRETDRSMEWIAHRVGCKSADYFSHLFRHETGMTPREYRKAK